MSSWRDCGRYSDFKRKLQQLEKGMSRTRENIEADLNEAKQSAKMAWDDYMRAEKHTLETGEGHDERLKKYNFAKYCDKSVKKLEEELKSNPIAYKNEQKRKFEKHSRLLEKAKRVERSYLESQNLCCNCGIGKFSFWKKECKHCGRKKDY
jgi:hypothetical protein